MGLLTLFFQDHLVGCYGKRITIWNTQTWEKFASFLTHDHRVDAVQLFMEDHHAKRTGLLLTGSQDETVRYWDLRTLVYHSFIISSLGTRSQKCYNDHNKAS